VNTRVALRLDATGGPVDRRVAEGERVLGRRTLGARRIPS
jgi:hypothetical protein